jgi:hypothetical protein
MLNHTIGTPDGNVTVSQITVAATATLIIPVSDNPRKLLIINNGASVMDIGGPTVAPGNGIPLQPGGGSFSLDFDFVSPGITRAAWYAAYPSGGGDCRVVELI